MKYATIAARSILGLIFLLSGVMFFIAPMEMKLEGHAAAFMGALAGSGYLGAVKVVEIIGGALTISGRYTPTGLLMLGPIVVNIALYHVFMDRSGIPMAIALGVLSLFLLYAYRKNFAGILCCKSCGAS
jgi:putative oxidoreductase